MLRTKSLYDEIKSILHHFQRAFMKQITQFFSESESPTWKVWFSRAKKYFLKQCIAQDGMLQPCSQCFLPGKKVGNIAHYFWWVVVISWSTMIQLSSLFTQKCMWKNEEVKVRALKIEKIMLFVAHHKIFISIIPSK